MLLNELMVTIVYKSPFFTSMPNVTATIFFMSHVVRYRCVSAMTPFVWGLLQQRSDAESVLPRTA